MYTHTQLSLVPMVVNNANSARAYMAKKDFAPAIELLGEAIEVCQSLSPFLSFPSPSPPPLSLSPSHMVLHM